MTVGPAAEPSRPAEPIVLRSRPSWWLLIGPLLPAAVILPVLAIHEHPAVRRALLGMFLFLLLFAAAVTVLLRSQRVGLDDDALRTRRIVRQGVKGPIRRDEIEDVQPISRGLTSALALYLRDGRRVEIGLTGTKDTAWRDASTIRAWAGVHAVEPVPEVPDTVPDQHWEVPSDRGMWVIFLMIVGVPLVVPASLLWHPVPWWGWPCAVVQLATFLLTTRPLKPARVELAGDRLTIIHRRPVTIAATRVRRVVTLGESPRDRVVLDVMGRRAPVPLPVGDQGRRRAALVQRWAEHHGGGGGSDQPLEQPRSWPGLAIVVVMFVAMCGCCAAIMPAAHRPEATFLLFGIPAALMQFLHRLPVSRDWSKH